ncbi:MAG: pyruvate, water dikinase regulatory protein [Pseudomonadota bacterium]
MSKTPSPSLTSKAGSSSGAASGVEAGGEPEPLANFFHVHLVSDSTGETLNSLLKAVTSQFLHAKPFEHIYALIRSRQQMERTLAEIEAAPGLVLYTVVNPDLRRMLEVRCAALQAPAVSVLDPFVAAFSSYLGMAQSGRTGAQHTIDESYFKRIDALDYTLAHDDGQMTWDLEPADVVIVGVSRTSKTPTCMYLANRGVKAANVPLIKGQEPPEALFKLRQPLIIGLVASPDRLEQIRTNRLDELNARDQADTYTDIDEIRAEIVAAKRLFAKHRWPTIDVTRRSVEETAAAILTKLSARQNAPAVSSVEQKS